MKRFIALALPFLFLYLFSCKETKQPPVVVQTVVTDTVVEVVEHKLTEDEYNMIFDSIGAASKIKELTKALDKQFRFSKLNGCVLIEQAGITLINECNGSPCLRCEEEEPLTPTTIFQLASVSKTFTAILTLKLIEEKKLALTDTVQKFYPDFPFHGVTIEQLLAHRSGLPNYIYAFEDSAKTTTYPSNQKIMEWFSKSKVNRYNVPGRSFSYNNSNYAVLAAIIEKASGKSYTEYIEKTIFKPLKMNHTYVITAIPDSVSRTVGHEGKRQIKKDFNDEVLGDKGIYSCTNDLLLWYRSLKNNTLLTPENMKLVFTPRSFERPGIRNYGLGFRMILDKGSKVPKYIYHNGWWKGYSTLFWFDPKTETFITILNNKRNRNVYKTDRLIDILNKPKKQESKKKKKSK